MFTIESTVKLHQTDGAGIVYFGSYFSIAHDVYETFMESAGYDFDTVINKSDTLILIVHAEADYRRSLSISEKFKTDLKVERIGSSSFALVYDISNSSGETVCNVQTVHVAVDKKTKKKKELPKPLKSSLKAIS